MASVRVVVPYARNLRGERAPYPETRAALAAAGVSAEYVDVSGSSSAYHELVLSLWADGVGFVVVEQDIVVRPGVIGVLADCPEPWCGYVYPTSTGWLRGGLGCTRFSTACLADHPMAVVAIDTLRPDGMARREWGRLDTRLKQVLEDRERLTFHPHWPAVDHLNPAQPPPITNCVRCGATIPDAIVRFGPPPYPCPRCDSSSRTPVAGPKSRPPSPTPSGSTSAGPTTPTGTSGGTSGDPPTT